jgi:hypothetical protein
MIGDSRQATRSQPCGRVLIGRELVSLFILPHIHIEKPHQFGFLLKLRQEVLPAASSKSIFHRWLYLISLSYCLIELLWVYSTIQFESSRKAHAQAVRSLLPMKQTIHTDRLPRRVDFFKSIAAVIFGNN